MAKEYSCTISNCLYAIVQLNHAVRNMMSVISALFTMSVVLLVGTSESRIRLARYVLWVTSHLVENT